LLKQLKTTIQTKLPSASIGISECTVKTATWKSRIIQKFLATKKFKKQIKELAQKTNTPLVAAHDVYYMKPSDRLARETMVKIGTGGVVDTTADHDTAEDFSFKTQAEMKEWFKDTPEAISNTVNIADQCNVSITLGQDAWMFPKYIIESGRTPDDELHHRSWEGVKWRDLDPEDEELKKRLTFELDVIKMKGLRHLLPSCGRLAS
jgi:DNA polymerase-3 subunit alpha